MHQRHRYIVAALFLIIVGLWFATPYFIPKWADGTDKAGPFGDMFGAINALFSGLAFGGVCLALALQYREIVETKTDLQKQVTALSTQIRMMRATALLNAVPQLLEQELAHVRAHHLGELVSFPIDTVHVSKFPPYIAKMKKEVEEAEALPGAARDSSRRCLIGNLERIYKFKSTLSEVYDELDRATGG